MTASERTGPDGGPVATVDTPPPGTSVVVKSGFATSEFAATAGTIVANLVGLFVLTGRMPEADKEHVTNVAIGLIVAAGAFIANAIAAWRYIQSRETVKASYLGAINATAPQNTAYGRATAIRI